LHLLAAATFAGQPADAGATTAPMALFPDWHASNPVLESWDDPLIELGR
jgi:hypothetical protein